jgi:hypothetical protein
MVARENGAYRRPISWAGEVIEMPKKGKWRPGKGGCKG